MTAATSSPKTVICFSITFILLCCVKLSKWKF